MRLALIVAIALLAGCGSEKTEVRYERWCDQGQSADLERMIISCAKAANPLSDEEGEDLVSQCEQTARATVCPVIPVSVRFSCDGLGACYRKDAIAVKELKGL